MVPLLIRFTPVSSESDNLFWTQVDGDAGKPVSFNSMRFNRVMPLKPPLPSPPDHSHQGKNDEQPVVHSTHRFRVYVNRIFGSQVAAGGDFPSSIGVV